MRSYFKDTFTAPFILSKDNIDSILKALPKEFDDITITADCCDRIARKFEGVEELYQYQNTRQSRLLILHIVAKTSERGLHDSIDLRWARDQQNINAAFTISISADNETIIIVRSKMDEIISTTKPWYHLAVNFDHNFIAILPVVLFLALLAVWFFDVGFGIFSGKINDPDYINTEFPSGKRLIISVWFIIALVLGWFLFIFIGHHLIIKPKRLVFPAGVFLIGEEIRKHESNGNIRGGILLTVATLVASAAVALGSMYLL